MIRAASAIAPFWYTPKSEENEEVKTSFHIRGMTGIQKVQVFTEPESRLRSRLILAYGLIGCRNYSSADGKLLDGTPVSDLIDTLKDTMIYELVNRIMEATTLAEQEKKDSQSQ